MELIEALAFTKALPNYLSEDSYREFQTFLIAKPLAGDVITGTGGFRKVRYQDTRRGKGKRGGLRIIYYFFPEEQQLWLLTLYDKDEAIGLTSEQKRMLKAAIDLEKQARSKTRRHL
jgi:hypothetical protein